MSQRVLAYNTNVHPLANWDELMEVLRGPVREIALALQQAGRSCDLPAEMLQCVGLDFHLPAWLIDYLSDNGKALTELRGQLEQSQAVISSFNVFPLFSFQEAHIKDRAYQPDWSEKDRVEVTIAAIRVAAALCDDDVISMSTVPGTYRAWHDLGEAKLIKMRQHFALYAQAAHAFSIEHNKQRRVVLCLEAEPGCWLQWSHDLARFWQQELIFIADYAGLSLEETQRYFALCWDTCHASVMQEDQERALTRCEEQGALPLKVQVSAAPRVAIKNNTTEAVEKIRDFDEERFLHQCSIRSEAGSFSLVDDIPELVQRSAAIRNMSEIRSHFHVPLHWATPENDLLQSTVCESKQGLAAALHRGARHIAVETYTWSVLPQDFAASVGGIDKSFFSQEQDVCLGTVQELIWLGHQFLDL